MDAWGRTFAALGIEYKGGTLVLDLLDRKHKCASGPSEFGDAFVPAVAEALTAAACRRG